MNHPQGGTTVAIVGVVGTFPGAVVGAVPAPWVSGRLERRLRILDRRLDTNADLLEVAGHIRDNAQTWSTYPLADAPQPPADRIRSMDARIRMIGSDRVRETTERVATLATRFQTELVFRGRPKAARDFGREEADSPEAMLTRMDLGRLADEMTEADQGA